MYNKNPSEVNKILTVLTCLFCITTLFAQVDTAWVRRYNGTANASDYARAMAVDNAGNVYVTGNTANNENWPYDHDYLTVKYNTSGDLLWVSTYAGPGAAQNNDDYALAIAVDDAGNAYVTGHSPGSGTSDDVLTIKYEPGGDTAWVRRYNGPGNDVDVGSAIAVDGSGNVYVTGNTYSAATSDNYLTIKYDSNGNMIWLTEYNGPPGDGGDYSTAIALDTAGNIYITGRSFGGWSPLGMDDYLTIKYTQVPGILENGSEPIHSRVSLSVNHPNPFREMTQITYGLPYEMAVNISVYSALGQLIKTLVDDVTVSGSHIVTWNGTDNNGRVIPGGIYFVRLAADQDVMIEKSILVK